MGAYGIIKTPIYGGTLCGVSFAHFLFLKSTFKKGCFAISAKELFINDDIHAKEVRLLDENGDQLGIKSLSEAKDYAYDRGVDLVCIAPQAQPPVCRAMDYGKYRYEQDKREKEQKKKQQTVEVKEVQLSCRIDKHDFDTKAQRAIKFLKEGNKVNPLIGNAGVSAVPDSARVSNNVGLEYDKKNYLLMHAMGPNVAGVIGTAVAAGILLGFLS